GIRDFHVTGVQTCALPILYSRFSRYSNPESEWATEQYAQLAEQHGLTLTQLALAFIKQQFFVTSTIIGATILDQLKENIQAFERSEERRVGKEGSARKVQS